MGTVEGKVPFITGAGRGRGRSHDLRPAEEGADLIVALDTCADDVETVPTACPHAPTLTRGKVVEKG